MAHAKESTEELLYSRLTDLTNLDLRPALYDLTSTYFETPKGLPTNSPLARMATRVTRGGIGPRL